MSTFRNYGVYFMAHQDSIGHIDPKIHFESVNKMESKCHIKPMLTWNYKHKLLVSFSCLLRPSVYLAQLPNAGIKTNNRVCSTLTITLLPTTNTQRGTIEIKLNVIRKMWLNSGCCSHTPYINVFIIPRLQVCGNFPT